MNQFTNNSDNNNPSNVQNLNAMLVALANSSSSNNNNSLDNGFIQSSQSAFSLLTKQANGVVNNNTTGEFSGDTTPSPLASTSLLNLANNNNQLQSQKIQLTFLPNFTSPKLSESSSLLLDLSESSSHNINAAATAFKKFSKIFENVENNEMNVFNSTMLSKIQQHFCLDSLASNSNDSNNFSLFSNQKSNNNLNTEQELQNLPQNFLQQNAFTDAPSNLSSFKPVLLQHQLNNNTNFQQINEQKQQTLINNVISNTNKLSNSISNNNETNTNCNATLTDNVNPERRIRRRRPKSPKTLKYMTKNLTKLSPDSSNFSFNLGDRENNEMDFSEPQTSTPEDPVIHSSSSLLKIPSTSIGMTLNGVKTSPESNNVQITKMNILGSDINDLTYSDASKRSLKMCHVCGDNATGYNFNVITCESCKAFFRRNALRPKNFKCPYSDNCEINTVTRRFCQKCRLKKCFAVGMKKEWILNDEQLKRRKNSRLNSAKQSYQFNNSKSQNIIYNNNSISEGSLKTLNTFPVTTETLSTIENNYLFGSNKNSPPIQSMINSTNFNSTISPLLPSNQVSSPNSSISCNINIPSQIKSNNDQYDSNILNTCTGNLNNIYPLNSTVAGAATAQINGSTSAISNYNQQLSFPAQTGEINNVLALLNPAVTTSVNLFGSSIESLLSQQLPLVTNNNVTISAAEYQRLKSLDPSCNNEKNQIDLQLKLFEQMNSTQNYLMQQTKMMSNNNFTTKDSNNPLLISQLDKDLISQRFETLKPILNHSIDRVENVSIPKVIKNDNILPNYTNQSIDSFNDINKIFTNFNYPLIDFNSMQTAHKRNMMHIETTIQNELNNNTPLNPNQIEMNDSEKVLFHNTKSRLSSLDKRELNVLLKTFSCLNDSLSKQNSELSIKAVKKLERDPTDLLNLIDISMRRFVKAAKDLSAFRQITQEGKLQLLKASMIDLITFRGMTLLDSNQKFFESPVLGDKRLSCNFFDKLNHSDKSYHFFDGCKMISEEIRKNSEAIVIMYVIILFSHYDALLDEQDKIIAKRHSEEYFNMLQRYMETIYPEKTSTIMIVVPEIIAHLKRYSPLTQTSFAGLIRLNETEDLPAEFFKTKLEDEIISVDDVDDANSTSLTLNQTSKSDSGISNESTASTTTET